MKPGLYGLMAEFETPRALLEAARRTYAAGYRHLDAYSPFAVEGLSKAIGFHRTMLPFLVFVGGVLGAVGGYGLQYYLSVVSYPLNIGGRPFNSLPAFIPVTFECAILVAALVAVLGMFALNGLPRPHHPVFNVDRFQFASRDRFFLCIEAVDPRFDLNEAKKFFEELKGKDVVEVRN